MSDSTAIATVPSNDGGAGSDIRAMRDNDLAFFSTVASRREALAAVTAATPVSEYVGKKFNLANLIVQEVQITDDQTGEVTPAARVILIDDKGVARYGVSKGLLTSAKNILSTLGTPTENPEDWPLPVTVVQAGKAPRAYFTIVTH